MPIRFTSYSADFSERFNAFLDMKREVSADIDAAARAISQVADALARTGRGLAGRSLPFTTR